MKLFKSELLFCGVLCASLCLLFSCSQNENDFEKVSQEPNEMKVMESFEFIYHGEYYTTDYYTVDSVVVISDEKINDILESLKNKPNLATFIHENGLVEYFDDELDMKNNLKNNKLITRNAMDDMQKLQNYETTAGYLTIFKDSKKKGPNFSYKIDGTNRFVSGMPDLRTIGMGSEVSSMTLSCDYIPRYFDPVTMVKINNVCKVTFYSGINYSGWSVSWTVSPLNPQGEIHYFKSIKPFGPYLNENWNDRANSFKFETTL